MSAGDRRRRAALLQAGYYVVTGVWPLVHRRSFERITGPKVDYWLVRTVGVLVAAIGAGLAVGARTRVSPQLEVTAVLAAGGLAAIDVVETGRGRISPVYLADALLEAALIAYWRAARRD